MNDFFNDGISAFLGGKANALFKEKLALLVLNMLYKCAFRCSLEKDVGYRYYG